MSQFYTDLLYHPSPNLPPMSEHILNWNVRGLNSRARRCVVRDLATQQRASILCLQETKVAQLTVNMISDLMAH